MHFFRDECDIIGLDFLARGAAKGHLPSAYAFGILQLYLGEEGILKGSRDIFNLRNSLSNSEFEKCRRSFIIGANNSWRGGIMFTSTIGRPRCCKNSDHRGYHFWENMRPYLNPNCELCKIDMEVDILYFT